MKTSQTVAKNTFLLTVGLFSGRILAVFVIRKMTPILGPTGMGIWGLATDLSAILLVVANFGLNPLITREATRRPEWTGAVLWTALRLRWLLGLVCYGVLIVYLAASGYDQITRAAVLITGIAVFVEATAMACDSVLQAREKVQYQTLGQIVSALAYFVLAWWWLDAGLGLMGVIWANLASRVLRLAVMVPLMFAQTGPWRWRAPAAEPQSGLRWMMALGVPLFLATTFGIVSYKIDTVMLSNFEGAAATGVYVLGHRALDYLLYLPNIFATALFPALARYGGSSLADAARLGERALRFTLAGALPLTLLVVATAPAIIGWFDPSPDFADSVPVLRIVVWGMVFQSVNLIIYRLLLVLEMQRVFIVIGAATLIVNVGLNVVLIPRYSYFGASVATIFSLAVSCALHFRYLGPTPLRPSLGRTLARPVAAMLLAWGLAYGLERLFWPGIAVWTVLPLNAGWGSFSAVLGAAGGLYALFLIALRVITRRDVALAGELLGRSGRREEE